MDDATRDKLAVIGKGLVGPDGKTLEDVQAERAQEEAEAEAKRQDWLKRLEAAYRTLQWAQEMSIEPDYRHLSGRERRALDEDAAATWLMFKGQLATSDDPEAFILKLEDEAVKAKTEVESLRQQTRQHAR